ncbi:MAG: hypothetical protein ABFC94_02915 [Syntrophomonas sp.]
MEPWSITTILVAFGGGVLGTAFGALWSIFLCALLILAGSVLVMAGGSDFLLMQIGLGPVFGPHVGGFAAGLAAASYAAGYKKNHPNNDAKDILSPLMDTSWDVLAVGGLFSVLGHILAQLLPLIPVINQFDVLALDIVLVTVIARFMFYKGEMIWGNKESIKKYGYLGNDDYKIAWMPWMSRPAQKLMLGIGVGTISPVMAMMAQKQMAPLVAQGTITATDSFVVALLMGWTLGLLALLLLNVGQGPIQKVPITHCVADLSALAFLLSGSLALGIVVGVFAAFLEELAARMVWNHGSNHIDPPATAIAFGTLILSLLLKPEFLNLARFFK